jgi:hypothetical protein
MALGTTVDIQDYMDSTASRATVYPAGIRGQWVDVIDAAGMDDADNSGNNITNPTTQITASTRKLVQASDEGTLIRVRMQYDDGLTSITDAVIQVFGRHNSDEMWMPLHTKETTPALTATMTTASTDLTDGTDKFTAPDPKVHTFDTDGCSEFIFGVKTALAGTGDATTAKLQAKFI